MKTKHVAFILIISSLITTMDSSGMSYIRNWYHSLTSQKSEPSSPGLIRRFINRCRKVGVIPTISAAFGIYNFKTMSGLEYDALDTYDSATLKAAQDRVGERIKDLGHSQKLEDYFMLIQRKYLKALNREENIIAEKEVWYQ